MNWSILWGRKTELYFDLTLRGRYTTEWTLLLLLPFSVSKDRPPEQMQSHTCPEKQVKLSY